MSDIVERLRLRWHHRDPEGRMLDAEAADEIERLRAALRGLVSKYKYSLMEDEPEELQKARRALENIK